MSDIQIESDKSMVPALLLCFFLGFLGVHRFYVGKVGTGILMIVYAGMGLYYESPKIWQAQKFGEDLAGLLLMIWIWAIIDFVRIIKGSFGDKENRGLS